MSLLDPNPRPVRVALVHLFATGAYRPNTRHGLVHLGLLPLEPGAQVQDWLVNPERDYSRAVTEASGVANDRAKAAPSWAEVSGEVEAELVNFDVLLIMDRAGTPSPERHWLEQRILTGLERPPVCVGLDELLAFFLPAEVLDDADELLKKLVVRDKTWSVTLDYGKRKPQLPFILQAMRRAVHRVLTSLLKSEGSGTQKWQPVYTLLTAAVNVSPRSRDSRAFRLLAALARQPGCCDVMAPSNDAPTPVPLPSHPSWPDTKRITELLDTYLARWRDRVDDAGAPELGLGDVSEQQVETAFEDLGKRLSGASKDGKEKFLPRAQQVEYARFVARAIGGRGAYAIEAGTGTGKTFGYLVPALEYLRHAPEGLVVVATSTKNLQEQMRRGEIPGLLREPDGSRNPRYKAIRTATLKGKNCYLCADALDRAYEDYCHSKAEWADALAWLYLALRLRDTEGEVEGIARCLSTHTALSPALRGLLRRVAADRACRHGPLANSKACVYPAHRVRAEQTNLLIVNHHKLALLPPKAIERATVCIVDEADRFPDNFRSALARSLDARELQTELLEPLLQGQLQSGGRPPAESSAARDAKRERRGIPFLDQLMDRLAEVEQELWEQVPPAERPAPDEASRAAYEAVEEARLADLGSRAALLEEVAELMSDTPVADDARHTADAAWHKLAAESAPFRRRQAWRAAWQAILDAREPLNLSQVALADVSSLFQRQGSRPAALPFGPGETHWQDNLRIEQPGQRPMYRPFHRELVAAMPTLRVPLEAAALQLGRLRRHLSAALNVTAAEEESEETATTKADERLWKRAERFAEFAQSQAEVLARLLAEFPCRGYVPVVEREPTAGALGWRLVRQPYELWSYLGATPDPATGLPLAPEPDEPGEVYSRRLLAARAALGRLSGEPGVPLLEQFRTVVFTSATLYVEGELHYFRQLLDMRIPFAAAQRIQPLFDYNGSEAVLGGVPAYLPEFRSGAHPNEKRAWCEAQLRTLLPLLVALEGRTLVLFTSNEDMHFAAEWLGERLAAHDIEMLIQNGASEWEIRRFRQVEQSVLLGVDRMWTGVDFAGPTLSQVIVWRLPFPSLGEPLISHRKRYEADEVFWGGFYRPAARLKLRQGFGRLVRRLHDKGSFLVLDARVATAFYAGVLNELEVEDFQHFASPNELLEHTAGPLLKLLGLGGDFRRRELSVHYLLDLCLDQDTQPTKDFMVS